MNNTTNKKMDQSTENTIATKKTWVSPNFEVWEAAKELENNSGPYQDGSFHTYVPNN